MGAVDGAADVDAASGLFLRSTVGREDLDGVIDAGSCDQGFIRMSWNRPVSLKPLLGVNWRQSP